MPRLVRESFQHCGRQRRLCVPPDEAIFAGIHYRIHAALVCSGLLVMYMVTLSLEYPLKTPQPHSGSGYIGIHKY